MNPKTVPYFKLFASCIPVKGVKTSLICDIDRNSLRPIPNLLYDVVQVAKTKTIAEVKSHFHNEMDKGIDAFFGLLVEEEYAFYTDEPDAFSEMDLTWDWPSTITNAILDFNQEEHYDILNILKHLEELRCEAIQIRISSHYPIDKIENWLKALKRSSIKRLEFIIKWEEQLDLAKLFEFYRINNRTQIISVHSAPESKIKFQHQGEVMEKRIQFFQNRFAPEKTYEKISTSSFSVNIPSFTEAQNHNLGLNRKVCIDIFGFVKNHTSHKNHFGNINNESLESIIKKTAFQSLWNITKDEVETCKDCEYRYVCVDNAEIEKKNNKFSRVKKCEYDPYKSKWSD